jgi:hypothetical protein
LNFNTDTGSEPEAVSSSLENLLGNGTAILRKQTSSSGIKINTQTLKVAAGLAGRI